MKVHEFNLKKGRFKFEENEIETEFHAHPAVEIILAENGEIELETPAAIYSKKRFVIIDANVSHKIKLEHGKYLILMIECNASYFNEVLLKLEMNLDNGIYVDTMLSERAKKLDDFFHRADKTQLSLTNDERIKTSLNFLENSTAEYKGLLKTLKSKTNLSESRLSHLFKAEIGISIKKYLVWTKLKRAFLSVLSENKNMYQASFESGFYDQAHLSKAFKQLLGINPSKVYNSRTLQI